MKAIPLTPALVQYVEDHAMTVSPVLAELQRETASHPRHVMQITKDEGAFLHLLAKLVGAERIVEVGCYTGYSAIAMASALPPGGKLYTLDVDPEATAIARRYFAKAGLADRIELRLAPGEESLRALLQEEGRGAFDLMFIDADKQGMVAYYELGLELVRPGGLIVADNALFGGGVVDPAKSDPSLDGVRRFNAHVKDDERVDRVMLNVSDGIYVLRKR